MSNQKEKEEDWFKAIIALLTKINNKDRVASDSGEVASVKIQADGKILLDLYMSPKPSHVILTYEEFIKVLNVHKEKVEDVIPNANKPKLTVKELWDKNLSVLVDPLSDSSGLMDFDEFTTAVKEYEQQFIDELDKFIQEEFTEINENCIDNTELYGSSYAIERLRKLKTIIKGI